MTFRLGLVLDNAEIIDQEETSGRLTLTIMARGLTKNACQRGARKEAAQLIPYNDQVMIDEVQRDSFGVGQRWIFVVVEDQDG